MKKWLLNCMSIILLCLILLASSCGGKNNSNNKHTHSFVAGQKVYPTCSIEGYTLYTCACGASEQRNKIPTISHNYAPTPVAATCQEKSHIKYTCKTCFHTYKDNFGDKLGNHTGTKTCSTCKKNIFSLFKNIIKKNGVLNEDGDYTWNYNLTTLGQSFLFNANEESIIILHNSTSSDVSSMVAIRIDSEMSGKYAWMGWYSSYDMGGILIATTWTEDSLLGYSSNTFPSYLTSNGRSLFSSQIDLMLTILDILLNDYNLGVANLGFILY